jgi:hypothetical protein
VKADWLLAVLVLLAAATTPGIATSNEPPLADAGLDQTTTRGSTVYLDGGGSRDPDGVVSSYEWPVTTPAGTATTLDCGNCERSQFQATSVGTYEVTLQFAEIYHGVAAGDGIEREALRDIAADVTFARADPGDRLLHFLERAALGQETGNARFQQRARQWSFAVRGEDDHAAIRFETTDALARLEPADPGHLDVDQRDVGPPFAHEIHRLFAGGRLADDLAAEVFEQSANTGADQFVIIGYEDPRLHASAPPVDFVISR